MMRTRVLLSIAFTVAITVAATTAVMAATGDTARQDAKSGPLISGTGKGGGCKMGYDTESSTLTPPDDSTADNVAAGSVTLTKGCNGPVVGQFTSEVGISSGGFIHIDMRATCIGTGGFTNHCTVGQVTFASPGHTFFSQNPGNIETHAMNMVWVLLPGQWRFDVLPGGNGTAFLDFRTFTVEAFAQ
jgi:hypothetical protein